MLAAEWTRLIVVGLVAASVYFTLTCIARALAIRFKARKFFRRFCRSVTVIAVTYLAVLLIAYWVAHPWQDATHWKNGRSLEVAAAAQVKPDYGQGIEDLSQALIGHARYSDVDPPTWVSEELLSRLNTSDTLIAVSISGGGSRAAYFAATVLEQLGKIGIPGQVGPGSSLVNHIDLLSTVSGGSIAGAYFAANLPTGIDTNPAELDRFFSRFKTAMATDFEVRVLHRLAMPRNTIAFVAGNRSGAEMLADVLDQELFQQQDFAALLHRELEKQSPILLINATDLRQLNPFVFTPDKASINILVPSQRPDSKLGSSSTARSISQYSHGREIEPFGLLWGDLSKFKIADAVAASAAFPVLLHAIRLHEPANGSNPTTFLGDGGVVDNSGLLSLYAHLFQRSMFRAASGRLRHVLIISIDASTESEDYTSVTAFTNAIYDIGQYQMQQFVLPEMLRRVATQDLADILEKPEWAHFQIPHPVALSYRRCVPWGSALVGTKLKLSAADRSSIEHAAVACVSTETTRIKAFLEGSLSEPPEYAGVLAPSDVNAWKTVLHLAQREKVWMKTTGRFIGVQGIKRDEKLWHDLWDDIDPATTGFVFETQTDTDLFKISATPLRYKAPGRISLLLAIPKDLMDADDVTFCDAIIGRFRGGDLDGAKATQRSPQFLPYVLNPYDMCR